MAQDAFYHRRGIRELPFFAKAAQAYKHMNIPSVYFHHISYKRMSSMVFDYKRVC